jgi:hypothetical protein
MNQALLIFLPHMLSTVGAVVILGLGWRTPLITLLISLPIYAFIFLIGIAVTPSRWLRAKATAAADPAFPPTTAVILGFGYAEEGTTMQPGAANQFLLDWLLETQPQVMTLFVQEGVYSAMTPTLFHEKTVRRIHRHDPAIYVDTLDTAFCALHELQTIGEKMVLLVAHDLQLQRAVWDFERVRQAACAQCTVVTAAIPDTPYPADSVHFQTRNEFIYKLVELLLLRPRDFLRATPTVCKAPL